jgi:hypothetical protein
VWRLHSGRFVHTSDSWTSTLPINEVIPVERRLQITKERASLPFIYQQRTLLWSEYGKLAWLPGSLQSHTKAGLIAWVTTESHEKSLQSHTKGHYRVTRKVTTESHERSLQSHTKGHYRATRKNTSCISPLLSKTLLEKNCINRSVRGKTYKYKN